MTPAEVEQMFTDAEYYRGEFLRSKGWTESSSYPDCIWRWYKEFDGKPITASRAEDAFRVEVAVWNRQLEAGEEGA